MNNTIELFGRNFQATVRQCVSRHDVPYTHTRVNDLEVEGGALDISVHQYPKTTTVLLEFYPDITGGDHTDEVIIQHLDRHITSEFAVAPTVFIQSDVAQHGYVLTGHQRGRSYEGQYSGHVDAEQW